jgi:hypothetical protein
MRFVGVVAGSTGPAHVRRIARRNGSAPTEKQRVMANIWDTERRIGDVKSS